MYDSDGSETDAVEIDSDDGYQMTDVEADADALASAGYGTDEDYGCFGGDQW